MTKTQMPEQVAWLHEEGDHIITAAEKRAANSTFARYGQGLITTDQAEAYADARVREALQEAGRIADDWAMRHCDNATADVWAGETIRALIPQENKS